jgi:hypothetical protein
MNYKILEQYIEPKIIREKIDIRTRQCKRHTKTEEDEMRAKINLIFSFFQAAFIWAIGAAIINMILKIII